jgi:hypothetical protein
MTDAVGAIYSLAGLLSLWFVVGVLWRSYRVSQLRQNLFNLRAELFDLAAAGDVPFNSPAYMQLRLTLNSLIRFAHRMNFLKFLYTLLMERLVPEQPTVDANEEWFRVIRELPLQTQTALNAIRRQTALLLMGHILRIPVTWLHGPDLASRQVPGRKPPGETAVWGRRRLAMVVRELEREAIEDRAREDAKRDRATPQYV